MRNINPIPNFGLLIVLFLIAFSSLQAQDIHFSQYWNVPLNLNPALTGAFEGDYRFRGNYRNQWNAIVPYNTVSASAEKSWCAPKCDGDVCWRPPGFSAGLLFNYDVAGDADLSLTQVELSGSYTFYLNPNFYLAGGLMIGGAQRSFDAINLFFDSQYNGKGFDKFLDPQESYDSQTKFLFDISTGVNLHYQSCDSRTGIDFGLGVFHLNQPKANFYSIQEKRLPSRFSAYGLGVIQLTSHLDLLVNGLAQFQGPYREFLLGPGLRINTAPRKLPGKLVIDIGSSYRFDDAFIFLINFNYQNLLFGASVDINTSGFRTATGGNGGLEFSLGYLIDKPDPAKVCKPKL